MNTPIRKNYRAFTIRFNRRTNVLLDNLHISLPYDPMKDVGIVPPSLIETRAIWDTGATNSVITKGLVKKMGLVPTGKEKVTNTSTVELRNTYLINVVLPNKVTIGYLKVTECEDVLGNGDADMLIGMDVIAMGDFSVSYENGKTVMSFIMPSFNTIDYVPISESENIKLQRIEQIEIQKEARLLHQPSKKKLKARRKKEIKNKKKDRRKR